MRSSIFGSLALVGTLLTTTLAFGGNFNKTYFKKLTAVHIDPYPKYNRAHFQGMDRADPDSHQPLRNIRAIYPDPDAMGEAPLIVELESVTGTRYTVTGAEDVRGKQISSDALKTALFGAK